MATLTLSAVTGNVMDVAPMGMVTLAGMFAPVGAELSVTVVPVKATDVSLTVQVEPAVGETEVGVQARLLKLGVCWMVTVPLLAVTGIDVPVAVAAEPPVT